MQNIEEQALATYSRTILLWLRYFDDTFIILSVQEPITRSKQLPYLAYVMAFLRTSFF